MISEIELKRPKQEIEELKQQVAFLTGPDKILTYQYNKIRDIELKKLFEIEQNLDKQIIF